jgi:putative ABC transport system substrate-binding protein
MRRLIVPLLLTVLTAPLVAEAQPSGKMFKVGLLANLRPVGQPPAGPGSGESMVVALRELGYLEGRNIIIERRYSEGNSERLPGLAAELVGLKPDVLYAHGGPQAAALQHATTTIPIVVMHGGDLVAEGLVASLAKPGGNVTGLQAIQPKTTGKRLALLKEVLPSLSRVGLLLAGTSIAGARQWAEEASQEALSVGRALRVAVHIARTGEVAGLDSAFTTLIRERVEAMLIPSTNITNAQRGHLADLARSHRIATIGDDRSMAEAGFLMGYGADIFELTRRAAAFVDKILRGAKPADLPVEQPKKFELFVNLKTAKALGLTIPPSLLTRADQVIE